MARILTKEEWRRRKHIKNMLLLLLAVVLFFVIIAMCIYIAMDFWLNGSKTGAAGKENITQTISDGPIISVEHEESWETFREDVLEELAGMES